MGVLVLILMFPTGLAGTTLYPHQAYTGVVMENNPYTSRDRKDYPRAVYDYILAGDQQTSRGPEAYGFSGLDLDEEFDLYNFRDRLFRPLMDHLMTTDPAGQYHSHYMIAGNNPVNTADPDGILAVFALYSLTAMVAVYVHNIAGSAIRGDPVRMGFSNANKAINRQINHLKWSVYQNGRTEINIGINPFFLTASASVNHIRDDFRFTQGIGVGPGGLFVSGRSEYSSGGWKISAGYSGGTNFVGYGLDAGFNEYGGGYYRTIFGREIGIDGKPNPQITGGIRLTAPNFSLRLENDMFGDGLDRWRTSAAEIEVGHLLVGMNIYTNAPDPGTELDPDYESRFFKRKREGTYSDGKVYSSPLYVGFRHDRHVMRMGADHPYVQDLTQNFIHKYISRSPYFITPYGSYFSPYLKSGFHKRYSLY